MSRSDIYIVPTNRWYIERWEDYTYAPTPGGVAFGRLPPPAGAVPGRGVTTPADARALRAPPSGGSAGAGPGAADPPANRALSPPWQTSWGALKVWYR